MKKIYSIILLVAVMSANILGVKAQNVGDHMYDSNYQLCYEVLKTRTISTTLKECYVKVVSLATYQSDNNAPALSEEQIA